MPSTKIVILRMRELIYTGVFALIAIILLVLMFFMFWGNDSKEEKQEAGVSGVNYQAGIYTKELAFGESTVSLQVSLDTDHIKSVEIVPLDESVTTMYPLMEPAVETISKQLAAGVTPDNIELTEESQYTQEMILNAVEEILAENTKGSAKNKGGA